MPIKELLALAWHLTDAGLHMTRPHKKIRAVWAGVGVGWAAYWLITHHLKRKYVTTKGYDE